MTDILTTTITFYPEKYTPAMQQGSNINFDSIVLKSGENKVSKETLEALQKHPDFVFWSNQGAIFTTQKGIAGGEPVEITLLPTPEPTPTPEPEPTPTPTPPATQSLTLNFSGTQGFNISIVPIKAETPTPTPELIPTPVPTPELVPTPTPTPTQTPTQTPEPVPTPVPTPEPLTAEQQKIEHERAVLAEARRLGYVETLQTAPERDTMPEIIMIEEGIPNQAPADQELAPENRPVGGVPLNAPTDTIRKR